MAANALGLPSRETVTILYRDAGKNLNVTGEIDLDELERRLDVLEDPEADRIRRACEQVSGIGEQTSFDIVAEFDMLDDLRAAPRERLKQISNVGAERARALQEHL